VIFGVLSGVVAGGSGTPTPTPSPSFTSQPSVSPSSGTTGQTFTATPGTVINGAISSRAWLLNGTSISSGVTAVPSAAGTLTYQEFAGTASSAVQSVPVSAAITAMPTGATVRFDPSTVSAGNVTTWTDSIGGAVATQNAGSTTSHTKIASSTGGLPAVRLSGAAVLDTTGTNAANTATTGAAYTIVVIASNILDKGAGQSNPVLASVGTSTGALLEADTTSTGRYSQTYPCADAGIRTIAIHTPTGGGSPYLSINGGAFSGSSGIGGSGQVSIGGWSGLGNCGRADIHDIWVFPRALTAAETRQIHRRYCDLSGQAYPGGATARHVSFIGDSIMAGYLSGATDYLSGPGYTAARGLNLPWGTFDMLAVSGNTWANIKDIQLPQLGNIPAVTGTKNIICSFEYANGQATGVTALTAAAQAWVTAAKAVNPLVEVVLATSTDRGDAAGVANRQTRIDYDANLVAGLTGVTTVVTFHLDSNVGVIGSAPTNGTSNTYFNNSDGFATHLFAAGYALLDNGPYGMRPAIAARLAA
jgi:hypothetical protein